MTATTTVARRLTLLRRPAVLAVLTAVLATAGPAALASPNRPCGKVSTPRGAVAVTTFGAGGTCSGARTVVARVVKKQTVLRSYRGWSCKVYPGRLLSCSNASTGDNANARLPKP